MRGAHTSIQVLQHKQQYMMQMPWGVAVTAQQPQQLGCLLPRARLVGGSPVLLIMLPRQDLCIGSPPLLWLWSGIPAVLMLWWPHKGSLMLRQSPTQQHHLEMRRHQLHISAWMGVARL
jgi:hypothetical protein